MDRRVQRTVVCVRGASISGRASILNSGLCFVGCSEGSVFSWEKSRLRHFLCGKYIKNVYSGVVAWIDESKAPSFVQGSLLLCSRLWNCRGRPPEMRGVGVDFFSILAIFWFSDVETTPAIERIQHLHPRCAVRCFFYWREGGETPKNDQYRSFWLSIA